VKSLAIDVGGVAPGKQYPPPIGARNYTRRLTGLFQYLKKSLIDFAVCRQIANQTLRSSTMKRILSALIASVALFAAASGAAQAAAPSQCNGPASYCNVFFGN
jgi:hypothetical protein